MNALWLMIALLPGQSPFDPVFKPDPWQRRAAREMLVARVGQDARRIIEELGDDAVGALGRCSIPTARKLVEFYNSGQLDTLPDPKKFLMMLAYQRADADSAARWAMQNVKLLTEVDAFNAYCASPHEYAFGLRSLAEGAAQFRAVRLSSSHAGAGPQTLLQNPNHLALAAAAGGLVLGMVVMAAVNRLRSVSPVGLP